MRETVPPCPSSALAALWGKSDAGGTVNLLLQHLLDTAAVAETLWDSFLAPALRRCIDECCDGQGRSLFSLLCGIHDVGKASPAFQSKVDVLADLVKQAGLDWRPMDRNSQRWHHSLAGAVIVRRVLAQGSWDADAVAWVWPLVAGHHGSIPSSAAFSRPPGRGNAQGTGSWQTAQDALVQRVVTELGIDLQTTAPKRLPRRGVQLAISGAVVMADWIASDERHFPGVCDLEKVSMDAARGRARKAADKLDLRGGWNPTRLVSRADIDLVDLRFGKAARPMQSDAVDLAREMAAPGLLILEAPMGEGKTEAALAAVEVFAQRFGGDGVFIGMPTQATSDPMFTRLRRWLRLVDPEVPVGLLHGRRQFNHEWHELQSQVHFSGVDEFGCDDPYESVSGAVMPSVGEIPSEWFLGPKRGLLAPVTVGTIDQLLHAATRTRHVMLRHAGLAGRVVVLDEVHAYDVYMAEFLFEALRWLADAGVPVILLSATLPPARREDLARAYLQGALGVRDVDLSEVPRCEGYPSALSVWVSNGDPHFRTISSPPWRTSVAVRVEILDEASEAEPDAVVKLLVQAVDNGGCALVVRNTVGRAQDVYRAARKVFGEDVILLHSRLTAGARAERTERALDLLGPPDRTTNRMRPRRLVVVATQVAEQSFDVDVDLLVTDLAPIDLLLQRVGRLHRHAREVRDRPAAVRTPRVVVTGMQRQVDASPLFPRGSSYIYGDHLLLRSAALVVEATAKHGWSIPAQVPELVRLGYGDEMLVPASWASVAEQKRSEWHEEVTRRRSRPAGFLLSGEDNLGTPTLAGLHERPAAEMADDDAVAAVVRDGAPSVEVVLVRRGEHGYLSLSGRRLGSQGEATSDESILQEVVESFVRLPSRPDLTRDALRRLRPLSGWAGDPWLRRVRALVLDAGYSTVLGGQKLTYDTELGLIVGPA